MRLLALNGSPRGRNSNTRFLLKEFIDGFLATSGNEATTFELIRKGAIESAVSAVSSHDAILLGFPLYTDAMPGLVKEFIEQLGNLNLDAHRPKMLFLVQSGFPESTHTAPIARYLERLSRRLGCECVGVMRRGGIEGIRVQPSWATRRLLRRFRSLGAQFGRDGQFDAAALVALSGRDRIAKPMLKFGAWLSRVMYWDRVLKSNHAFERRLDAPYGRAAGS